MSKADPLKLRNDAPTLVDFYDRNPLVQDLAYHCNYSPPPLVLGVHGDWGSGKTSLLSTLEYALTNTCTRMGVCRGEHEGGDKAIEAAAKQIFQLGGVRSLKVVWFEAWRYQHEPNPVVPLLGEIRKQFDPGSKLVHSLGRWFNQDRHKKLVGGLSILEKLIQTMRNTAPVLAALDPGVALASAVAGAWTKTEGKGGDTIASDEFRAQLEHAISTIVESLDLPVGTNQDPKEKRLPRLVVIIDDLDRCEPEAAYRILEALKVYLNLNNTVFVLGMNQVVVEKALSDRFGTNMPPYQAQARAREYLNKICQNSWHITCHESGTEILEKFLKSSPTYNQQGATGNLLDEVMTLAQSNVQLPSTPRHLKAFANTLERFARRVPLDPTTLERKAAALLLAAYFSHFFPEIFRLLIRHEDFYQNQLVPFAKGETTAYSSVFAPFASHLKEPVIGEMAGAFDANKANLTFPDPVRDVVFGVRNLVKEYPLFTANDFRPYTRLPRRRTELCRDFADCYLETFPVHKGLNPPFTLREKSQVLEDIAPCMH